MSKRLRTHDFKQFALTINGLLIGGFGEEGGCEYEWAADIGEDTVGADGEVTTTEAYQELQFAAEDSGVSVGDVERAFRRLARSADDAAKGGGGSAEMFRRLAVDFRNTDKGLCSADAIFMDTAEHIAQTKNKTEQLAIAQDIFGRSGQALLPMHRPTRSAQLP